MKEDEYSRLLEDADSEVSFGVFLFFLMCLVIFLIFTALLFYFFF